MPFKLSWVSSASTCIAPIFAKDQSAACFNVGRSVCTKGNIVLNYCDIHKDDLPAISDRNKEKHGLITPGSSIPIISHEKMKEINPDYLLVFIWHFRKEVIDFEIDYVVNGGKLVFILPDFTL